MGNICRSPTAQVLLQQCIDRQQLQAQFRVDSAGTHAYHVGHAPDPRSQHTAMKHGLDLSQLKARQIQVQDFIEFDYIVAMDKANLSALTAQCPAALQYKLSRLLKYAPQLADTEVMDPYRGGPQGFETVLAVIEQGVTGLFHQICISHQLPLKVPFS